jgi:hypothetical protein
MYKIKEFVRRNSTGRKVLWLFVLTNLVYVFMLTITIPKTMGFSNGLKLLDMMPTGYSPEYVKTLFSTLGEEGRTVYLFNQIPIDMVYPGLFALSYSLLMGYFLRKLQKLDSAYFYLALFPLIAGVADYLENIGIVTMLLNFPEPSQLSMDLTNIFTIIKSLATTVFFMALILILVILGIKTLYKRKNGITSP